MARTKSVWIKQLTGAGVKQSAKDARMVFLTWRESPELRKASLVELLKKRAEQ